MGLGFVFSSSLTRKLIFLDSENLTRDFSFDLAPLLNGKTEQIPPRGVPPAHNILHPLRRNFVLAFPSLLVGNPLLFLDAWGSTDLLFAAVKDV